MAGIAAACWKCGGRGGFYYVNRDGRRAWHRCECQRPSREALRAQREMNTPRPPRLFDE